MKIILKLLVILMAWMLVEKPTYEDISAECLLMPKKCRREIAKEEDDRQGNSAEDSDDVSIRYQSKFRQRNLCTSHDGMC
jgi:hypothetical protein